MNVREDAPPYLDKASPEAWKEAGAFAATVSQQALRLGLDPAEAELVKLRASQLNGCLFCLDLHSRQARRAGITQQKLDILPSWRDTPLFTDREKAVLTIAEAATRLPISDETRTELAAARAELGDNVFAAAEWVPAAINIFNRISILSEHPIHPRDADGKLL